MTLKVPDDVASEIRSLASEFGTGEPAVRALVEEFWDTARRKEATGDWWRVGLKAARRRLERDAPAPDGRDLFDRVGSALDRHYYFSEPWCRTLVCLWVMQAYVVDALPLVFYLLLMGGRGRGKSNLQQLLARLTGGVVFEDISTAALARELKDGRACLFDEFRGDSSSESAQTRDAVLRSGYKRGAGYVRYDASLKKNVYLRTFGPKLVSYRGVIDEALADRGFPIPAVKPKGRGGVDLVFNNMWPRIDTLPSALQRWGRAACLRFPPGRLEEIARAPDFLSRLEGVVPELGANRTVELSAVALLVAEVVGVDVQSELRAANGLRETEVGEEMAELKSEVAEIVLAHFPRQSSLDGGATSVRVVQKDVRAELNRRRRDRGDPNLNDDRFATVRRELGVEDRWIITPKNRTTWILPPTFREDLLALVGEPDPPAHPGNTQPNLPNLANPAVSNGGVRRVSQVSLSEGVREEDLGLTDTRADRARARSEREDEP